MQIFFPFRCPRENWAQQISLLFILFIYLPSLAVYLNYIWIHKNEGNPHSSISSNQDNIHHNIKWPAKAHYEKIIVAHLTESPAMKYRTQMNLSALTGGTVIIL